MIGANGFPERFSSAIGEAEDTYTAIAEELGVTRSAVGHWAAGRRVPSPNDMERIARRLKVSVAWLAFGAGPMVAATAEAPTSATATAIDGTPAQRSERVRETKAPRRRGSAAA